MVKRWVGALLLCCLAGCSLILGEEPTDGDADGGAVESDARPGAWSPWSIDVAGIDLSTPLVVEGAAHLDTTARTLSGATDPRFVERTLESGGAVLVLAAESFTLAPGASLRVEGQLPLAILASRIDIDGTVDVASRAGDTPGAGADAATGCSDVDTAGRFGGAGGGHNGAGGRGGGGAPAGGLATAGLELRAGCPGGRNDGQALGAAAGGGAIQLIATERLTIGAAGVVHAGGAGGHAGGGTCCVNGGGGGGGGAGGMVVLDSPVIALASTGVVAVNGGGGGGGLDVDNDVAAGADGAPGDAPAIGGHSGCFGGPGGTGGAGGAAAGNGNQTSGSGAHGGGGGAAGYVIVHAVDVSLAGLISPGPTVAD